MDKNEKIIKKIKGLLALSRDKKNDEESQSAFIMAQKLMFKYELNEFDIDEVDENTRERNMTDVPVTVWKRLYWWERQLAIIISKNFRVKNYISNGYDEKRIMFFGYGGDLELAKEMYILAYDVLIYHYKRYVDKFYKENYVARSRYYTESIKSSYINGFLAGLEIRFEEQVSQLMQENALMVLIPEEVENAYSVMSADWGTAKLSKPNPQIAEAYSSGVAEAKDVDFTRSTIGDEEDGI